MSEAETWLRDVGSLLLLAAVAYVLVTYFLTQIRLRRRVKLAVGLRGRAQRSVSVAESTASLRSALGGAVSVVGRFLPLGDDDRRKLAVSLQRAGFLSSNALGVMFGVKFLALGGGLVLGFFLAFIYLSGLLILFGGLIGGVLAGVALNILPEWIVGRMASKRMWRLNAGLPDTFDLLVICLESGLTFDRALRRTVDTLAAALDRVVARAGRAVPVG